MDIEGNQKLRRRDRVRKINQERKGINENAKTDEKSSLLDLDRDKGSKKEDIRCGWVKYTTIL